MSKICPDETKLSEHPIVFNRDDDDDDDEDDMKEYDHNFVEVEKFE